MAERSILVRLRGDVSDFTREMTRGAKSLDDLARKAGETANTSATAMGRIAQSARLQAESWQTAGVAAAAVGAAILGLGALTVREFANFDQAMSGVASTGEDAKRSINELRDAALAAGADTAFSATEAAQGLEELARAGVSANDSLGGGLTGALDLAAAGQLEVAEAAGIASTAMTQFELSGSQVPHIADLLAAGAGKAMGGVDELGMALKQGGLVASQFGLSIEETVGGLSAFASAGLLGSDAGTAMKSMLLALANPAGETAQLLAELGINAYDASGQFVGLEGLAGQLQERMGGLDDATRQAALAQIFGTDAIRAASILYDEGAEGIAQWTNAVDDSGYAARTAAELQNNLLGDLEKLGGSWSTLAIQMGSSADGPLRSVVQGLTDVMDKAGELPTPVLNVATTLGVLAGAAALGAGGFMTLVPKLAETMTAFKTLKDLSPKTASAIAGVGKAAGVAAGVIATLQIVEAVTDHFREAAPAVEDYTSALKRAGSGGTEDFDKLFSGVISGADNFAESMRKFESKNADIIGKLINAGAGKEAEEFEARMRQLDAALTSAAPEQAAAGYRLLAEAQAEAGWSTEELHAQIPDYIASLNGMAAEAGYAALSTEQLAAVAANGGLPESLASVSSGLDLVTAMAQDAALQTVALAEAQSVGVVSHEAWNTAAQVAASGSEEAKEAYAEYIETVSGSSAAFIDLLGPMNEQIGKSREVAEAAAADSASSTDSWRDFYDGMSFNVDEYLAELERQVEAQENWQRNMVSLASRVSQETLDTLAEMGPEAAPLVAAMVDMTDAELAEMEGVFLRRGKEAGAAFGDTLADAPAVFAALGLKAGDAAVENAAAEVRAGRTTLAGIVEAYDLEFLLDANTDPALRAAYALQRRIESMTATMSVNARVNYYHANGLNAPVATGGYMADVAAAYGVEHLAGGGQARRRLAGLLNGPGSGVADLIPAMLSHREFVTNAQATSFYGPDFMYRLNRLEVPREALAPWRFADGGSPGYAPSAPAQQVPGWGSTTVTNVTQHVTQHLTFPGVNEVATIVEVVRDAARLNAQQGGDWTNG